MNTEQNYGGKDSHANDSEQSAKSATTQERTSSYDVPTAITRPGWPDPVQELDHLIADFVSQASAADNIAVINDLFYVWLEKEYRKSTKEHCAHMTFHVLRINQFLVGLQEKWVRLTCKGNLGIDAQKGGVSNG